MNTIHSLTKGIAPTKNNDMQSTQTIQSEDTEAFAQAVHGQEQDTKPKKASSMHNVTPGDAILQGLFQAKLQEGTLQLASINSPQKISLSEEVLQKLVDNILVSTKENNQEVHIRLQQSILADTSIIVRMEEGKLFVQLQTNNTQSALTLHQNTQDLENRLRACCQDREVRIKITEDTASSQRSAEQEHAGQQQSRGYFLWNE